MSILTPFLFCTSPAVFCRFAASKEILDTIIFIFIYKVAENCRNYKIMQFLVLRKYRKN